MTERRGTALIRSGRALAVFVMIAVPVLVVLGAVFEVTGLFGDGKPVYPVAIGSRLFHAYRIAHIFVWAGAVYALMAVVICVTTDYLERHP